MHTYTPQIAPIVEEFRIAERLQFVHFLENESV